MNAESPEGLIALRVAHRTCLNGMLAAVEFDRQPNLGTVEVDDE
ncbi:MAG TPA: hypothetical protein VEZ11_02500 [Thermoanaerobaculia bacterium]|nr:hypothetical protein [Thermoanaerobaculia bacterium]